MKLAWLLLALTTVTAVVLLTRPGEESHLPEPVMKSKVRTGREEGRFWEAAVAPEPAEFREPSAAVISLPPSSPENHRAEVTRLIQEGNEDGLNRAVAVWFEAEPDSVSEWLGQQQSFDALQTALGMIAGKLARDGDLSSGLEWAKLLQQGPERDQVFFDIYALAARGWRFSEAELRAAPLPPEKVELLLSGAAGD